MTKPLLFPTILILTLWISGCGFDDASRTELLRADHMPDSAVLVRTRNGDVTVTGAPDRNDVQVNAKITCSGTTAEEAQQRLSETYISIARDQGGTLIIEPVFPDKPRDNDGANVEVLIPDANGVEIETTNGRIVVAHLAGELNVDTSNGSVQVTNHDGPATVDSSNGNIVIEKLGGGLDARTSNGSIKAQQIAGPVRARTSNGTVKIALTPNQVGPIDLRSSNGSIEVQIGSSFLGRLVMDTSNGSIRMHTQNAPITSSDLRQTSGTLVFGNSDAASTISTSNGNIELIVAD